MEIRKAIEEKINETVLCSLKGWYHGATSCPLIAFLQGLPLFQHCSETWSSLHSTANSQSLQVEL